MALKEYFRLKIKPDETYYDFLLREDNAAERVQENEFMIQPEIRGYFVLEWCRFSDEQKATIALQGSGDVKITAIQKMIRDIYDRDAKPSSHRSAHFSMDAAEDAELFFGRGDEESSRSTFGGGPAYDPDQGIEVEIYEAEAPDLDSYIEDGDR